MTDHVSFDEEGFDPEEAERQIAEFLAAADASGPPYTEDLAAKVLDEVAEAQDKVTQVLDGQPANKVIATMLLLSRQHREHVNENTDVQWRLSAASTLVSGLIRPGDT